MDGPAESKSRWDGDSNSEWLKLAVETIDFGTWEFDLDQGTGFVSKRCAEIMGYSGTSQGQVIQFEDWLSRIHWQDRRRVRQACDPEGDGELKMRLQSIDTGGVIRQVLIRGQAFFSVVDYTGGKPVRKAVRLLGIAHTLSDRQLYQRALTESDQ